MASSRYFPKVLPPDTITTSGKASTHKSAGETHIQSRASHISWALFELEIRIRNFQLEGRWELMLTFFNTFSLIAKLLCKNINCSIVASRKCTRDQWVIFSVRATECGSRMSTYKSKQLGRIMEEVLIFHVSLCAFSLHSQKENTVIFF